MKKRKGLFRSQENKHKTSVLRKKRDPLRVKRKQGIGTKSVRKKVEELQEMSGK